MVILSTSFKRFGVSHMQYFDQVIGCTVFTLSFKHYAIDMTLHTSDWTHTLILQPCQQVYLRISLRKGGSAHADTHLLSDRGDTCLTSLIKSYRQHDLEEKDELINESVNHKALFRTPLATLGPFIILVFRQTPDNQKETI